MNIHNISAKTLARVVELAAAKPLSREYGEALAQALREASRPATFQPGQQVSLGGQAKARVLSIARNGVWILRAATDGEWIRAGQDQIRERVSIKALRHLNTATNGSAT